MVKSTGIVREVDVLGRVVIPRELRNIMNIDKGVPLEIFIDNDTIILKKYLPGCFFCGNIEGLVNFHGKNVCESCIKEMKEIVV